MKRGGVISNIAQNMLVSLEALYQKLTENFMFVVRGQKMGGKRCRKRRMLVEYQSEETKYVSFTRPTEVSTLSRWS